MKYLIGIDSDGTLRHSDGTISLRTRQIIKNEKDNGNIVVICTARPRYHALKISKMVESSHFLISSNGTEVFDYKNNAVIWGAYLSFRNCKKIYEDVLKLDLRVIFVTENTEYATKFIRNDSQILLDERNLSELLSQNIKQIMIIDKDKNKIAKYQNFVMHKYHLNVIDTSNANKEEAWFSIINKNASKGNALKHLAEYLNISDSNIIAIGNDNNDISMIKIAKIGVAMGNSTIQLKKEANIITKTNDEDGVYYFLKKWHSKTVD